VYQTRRRHSAGARFLLDELPPWHSNRLSRLIKTPKLHASDDADPRGGVRRIFPKKAK
jgi:hypothetical protein